MIDVDAHVCDHFGGDILAVLLDVGHPVVRRIGPAFAVPHTSRKAPSAAASTTSSTVTGRSLTAMPQSLSNVRTESRVTPARIVPLNGGVSTSSLMRIS